MGVLLDTEPAFSRLPRLTTLLVYPPTDHFLGRYVHCWLEGVEGAVRQSWQHCKILVFDDEHVSCLLYAVHKVCVPVKLLAVSIYKS